MSEFLNDGYVDSFRHLVKEANQYTWWSFRANARERNIGWRIDYQMITENLTDKIASVGILTDAKHSDHCPTLLELHE